MLTLNFGKKELNVKFGYKATAESGIIRKLVYFQQKMENKNIVENIDEILIMLPEFLLIGLQKEHRDEYGYDYKTGNGKEEQMEKMCDLLDDYFDDEESDFMDLFNGLQEEMLQNGFLAGLFRTEEEKAERKHKKEKN